MNKMFLYRQKGVSVAALVILFLILLVLGKYHLM